jgi:hypothetical protein
MPERPNPSLGLHRVMALTPPYIGTVRGGDDVRRASCQITCSRERSTSSARRIYDLGTGQGARVGLDHILDHFEFTRINTDVITASTSSRSA